MNAMTSATSSQDTIYPGLKPVEALERGFVLAPGETGIMAMGADWRKPAEFEGIQHRQGFRLGEIGIMIHFDEASELTEIPTLHHLPNTPRWLLGIANLHGRLIPVFDLLSYLGLERAQETKQMLLVLGHDADAAALVIDGLPQRLRWHNEEQSDADLAPKLLEPHVRATCLLDDKFWCDLDSASLLCALEQAMSKSL
ncbi:MAG: chemotaxis protein CheW [bacterium]|nr:chemotaxis protein CheW [bacterium]